MGAHSVNNQNSKQEGKTRAKTYMFLKDTRVSSTVCSGASDMVPSIKDQICNSVQTCSVQGSRRDLLQVALQQAFRCELCQSSREASVKLGIRLCVTSMIVCGSGAAAGTYQFL